MSSFAVTFDDGTHAMVPHENLQAALKDGGKLSQHMMFDDGTRALVPLERVHDAMHDGGSIMGEPPAFNALPKELLPPSFMERVGNRIQQNVYAIPHALDTASGAERRDLKSPKAQAEYDTGVAQEAAGVRHMTGQDATPILGSPTLGRVVGAATIAPRMIYDTVKGWIQDPAAAAGDIATAYIAHQAGGGKVKMPADRQPALRAPAPPPELPLTPEQQTQYTAALDKANTTFNEKAGTYHTKVSEAFDEAKRQHLEATAEHQQTLADIQKSHADAVSKAQAEFETATQKEAAAKLVHEQKVEAARVSREQADAVEQKRQQITETQQAMAEDTRQRVQAVYKENRTALDQQWNEIREGIKDAQGNVVKPGISEAPSPVDDTVTALNKAETDILRGTKGSVASFRALVKELGLEELTGVADDAEATTARPGKWYQVNPEQPTAPWQTLRAHSSSIGRAMASGDLGNLYPALKLVRDALEKTAGRIASENGWGAEYKATHSLEAQFRKDFEDLGPVSLGKGNPAARLVRAPNATFAADIIHGKASDLLEQALTRWDKSGELPTNIQQMHAMQAELKNLPKVKVLPEPPQYTGTAPTLRSVPAPDVPARPSLPERKPPTSPQLEKVEKPIGKPARPPELGFIARHAPRVIGKMVGGTVGGALGHPLIGYSVGGELGSELGTKLMKPKLNVPRTPEEYTRTILAAKEGDIPAGEADRLITRGGGRVGVIRKPQEPSQ